MKFEKLKLSKSLVAALLASSALISAHAAMGPMPALATANYSYDVYARENSTTDTTPDFPGAAPLQTSLFFNAGDLLTVTATGTWSGGGDCPAPYGAEGATCYGNAPSGPTAGINYFSLAGRIGETGDFFKIGSSYSQTVANSGMLYLAFVDTDAANNSGHITALVTAPVPEPETYALMLAGIGMIATVIRRRQRAA